ncbi:MAG: glycosyltransferase family 4 protein [Bacteroidales bacterium]
MKLTYIGTYPPRQCGIGTFTNNLIKAILSNTKEKEISDHANVVALNNPGAEQEHDYPEEVKFTIRQEHQRDYINAARYINLSDSRAVILNHEFGIFGGDDGVYILPLLYRLKLPLIVTFHTVLREPSFSQKSIVEEIGKVAHKIVVMSHKAVIFLHDIYNIPSGKIALIEHGVPDYPGLSREKVKEKYDFHGHKVLLTFGLLSRNKGIETVINALPPVVKKHPELLYIILGKTHPSVLKHSGEEYRNYLSLLAKNKGVQDNVIFLKTFLTEEVLFEYLTACDIYITPYLNEAQITSGTLSYAIGAGAAVLSTPYWHARELLSEGRGRLFNFKDSEQLSHILNEILDNPDKLHSLRKKAYDYGKKIRWPLIGKQYLDLLNAFDALPATTVSGRKLIIDTALIPKYSLEHIRRLTDDTGIVQHAKYGIPNLKEGYCLDDNARALLMVLMANRQNKDPMALEFMPIYLSYIRYLQNQDGYFRNFLSFNRTFLDERGSEDSFGRTIWALGYLIHRAPNESYREFGKDLFDHSVQCFEKLESIRGIANTIIGISYYLRRYPGDEGMLRIMKNMAGKIMQGWEESSSSDWPWFEEALTYDNAILPLSLFHLAEITEDTKIISIATQATQFLEKVTLDKGYLSLVGSNGWYPKNGERAFFDQQAIDTMANVRLFYQAYKVTKEPAYMEKMFTSYLWFLGDNELRLPLFDHETHGCCDGLRSEGLNRNQGAESTLAYWISHLTVLNAIKYEADFQ